VLLEELGCDIEGGDIAVDQITGEERSVGMMKVEDGAREA